MSFTVKTVSTGKNRLAEFEGLDTIAVKYAEYATKAAAHSLITFGGRINRVYTESVEDFYGHDTRLAGVARAFVTLDGKGLESTNRTGLHKWINIPWSQQPDSAIKDRPLRERSLKLHIGFAGDDGLSNEVAYQREFGKTGGGKTFIHSTGRGMIIPLYGRGAQIASGRSSQGSNAAMASHMSNLPRKFLYNQFASKVLRGGGTDKTGARWSSEDFWVGVTSKVTTSKYYDSVEGREYFAPKHNDMRLKRKPGTRGFSKQHGRWVNLGKSPKGGRAKPGSGNVMAIFFANPSVMNQAKARYGQNVYANSAWSRDSSHGGEGSAPFDEMKHGKRGVSTKEYASALAISRTGTAALPSPAGSDSEGVMGRDLHAGISRSTQGSWRVRSGYSTNEKNLQVQRGISSSEHAGSGWAMLTSQHQQTAPMVGFTSQTTYDIPKSGSDARHQKFQSRRDGMALKRDKLKMRSQDPKETTKSLRETSKYFRGKGGYLERTARPFAGKVDGGNLEFLRSGLSMNPQNDNTFDFYVKTGGGANAKSQQQRLDAGMTDAEIEKMELEENKLGSLAPTPDTLVRDSVGMNLFSKRKGTAAFIFASTGISQNNGGGLGEATGLTNVIDSFQTVENPIAGGKGQSSLISRYTEQASSAKAFRLLGRSPIEVMGGRDAVGAAYKQHRSKARRAFTQMSSAFAQADLIGPVMTEMDSRAHRGIMGQFRVKQGLANSIPLFAKVRMVKIGKPTGNMQKAIDEVSKSHNPLELFNQNVKRAKVPVERSAAVRSLGAGLAQAWRSKSL